MAAGAACPTYVDDTACLATSPRGAMRAMVALLAASHIAGLRPDSHTCGWVHVTCDPATQDRLRSTLSVLPLTVTDGGTGGGCWVNGLGAPFMCGRVVPLACC